ncbi:MAG: ATP-dependent zinc protease [Methylohalobius sp. ZOD2]|nr:ATP-dependent zinc protease [Methylothermaceae bacterium]
MNADIRSFFKSILLLVALSLAPPAWTAESAPIVSGWVEWVVLEPWGIPLKGKLDTGAKTSSLHAVDIEYFEREGEEWVRFKTVASPQDSKPLAVERPLVRDVRIKRHKNAYQKRPVVTLGMCLGDRYTTAEFSLIDRSRFNYPVLLGRRALKKKEVLVDASRTFTLGSDARRCQQLSQSARQYNTLAGRTPLVQP